MESIFFEAFTDINNMYKNNEINSLELKQYIESLVDSYVDDVYSEAFINTPARKLKEKLAELRKEKPNEDSSNKELKKFIENNYKDIVTCTDFLQKENKTITRHDLMLSIGATISLLGSYIGWYAGVAAFATTGGVAGMVISTSVFILTLIIMCVDSYIMYIRKNDDVQAMRELSKIKSGLEKASKMKGLDKETKKKLNRLMDEISDAETELYAKLKNIKESEYIDLYEDIIESINEKIRYEGLDIVIAEGVQDLVEDILFDENFDDIAIQQQMQFDDQMGRDQMLFSDQMRRDMEDAQRGHQYYQSKRKEIKNRQKQAKTVAGVTILTAAGIAALSVVAYKKYIKETKENLKKLSDSELSTALRDATTIGNTKVAKLAKEEMESRKKDKE